MDAKIARIEKLVKFEKQMLNSITQNVLKLTNRRRRIEQEMDRLNRHIESGGMMPGVDFDHVASRQTFWAMAEKVRKKIAEMQIFRAKLQQSIDAAQQQLVDQKVRVNVLEQLLSDRKNAHQVEMDDEQIRELLDIANRNFLEFPV